MRATGIVLVLLLAGSPAMGAEYGVSHATVHEKRQSQWLTIDADMSPSEYRRAYRQNQRLVVDLMEFHSKRALASTGVSERAIGVVGTAALAPVRDTRFHLNSSKTMAVEFQDVMARHRTLFLEFKKKW